MRAGARQNPPQYGGNGTSSPGYLACNSSSFRSSTARLAMASLWLETHAASRLPLGRLLKYFSEISRDTRLTVPVMQTCRSNAAQKKVSQALGLPDSSWPLRLS